MRQAGVNIIEFSVGAKDVTTLTHDWVDTDFWDRFDPDRMVGATLSPTTWFPFGGGNRRCLGATFAMVELRVVLREILRRVELATTTAPGPISTIARRTSATSSSNPVNGNSTDNTSTPRRSSSGMTTFQHQAP